MCEFFYKFTSIKLVKFTVVIIYGLYCGKNCKIPILPWPNQKIWAKICKCSKKLKKSLTDEKFKYKYTDTEKLRYPANKQ